MAAVFNKLGQTVIPKVGAAAFPDLLTVITESHTLDSGGATIRSTASTYTSIPCAYEPQGGMMVEQGGKSLSTQTYVLTMPTHSGAGVRFTIDPSRQRFEVQARGNEPAKTFRVTSVKDDMGVVFELICEREN